MKDIGEIMPKLKEIEKANEKAVIKTYWAILAWVGDQNYWVTDKNGELKLTKIQGCELRTDKPFTTMKRILEDKSFWENYHSWIIWSHSGENFGAIITEETVSKWSGK